MAKQRSARQLALMLISTTFAAALLAGCKDTFGMYRIMSSSMSPLIATGDRVVVDQTKTARTQLHDGDVICFRHGELILLKRILAMPGETISEDHRQLFRNGVAVAEPYLATPSGEDMAESLAFAPRTIPAGELFVMGDDRNHSLDSRFEQFGPVKVSDVLGQYSYTYLHGAPEPAKQ